MTTLFARQDLNGLPPEVLQQIASHLDDRPSLCAFSLASKTCHNAAAPSLFCKIHLTVHSREALQRDAHALIETLSRTESARHVRWLNIKGFLDLDLGEDEANIPEDDSAAYFEMTGVDEILDGHEPVFGTKSWQVCNGPVIKKASLEDVSWAPVVRLMKILPGLTTLEYNCRNQFPPLLLDAVHEHQCNLHHMTFRLRSLLSDPPDPYEMALATSPYLYKAQVQCAWRDSNGDDDFNERAMMELAAGLAPNLKEVILVGLEPPIPAVKKRRPRGSWRGLPGFVSGNGTGSLTSLIFMGTWFHWWLESIQNWAKHIDFGCLRHLGLGGGYTSYAWSNAGLTEDMMEWMIQDCPSLFRLRTLRISLQRHATMVERPHYADTASELFKRFEPLEELSVCGALEPKTLDAILSRHGPTLQKLTLRPQESESHVENGRPLSEMEMPMTFEKEHVLQIQAQCPALRELAVTVKRTMSSAVEAEIYKSFGSMERLRSLFLTLDCSDWRVTRDSTRTHDPSFDEFDRQVYQTNYTDFLRMGHVRENLLNCAVDERLARSIWETIGREKVGRPSLQSLRLWPSGGGCWGAAIANNRISTAVENLSRSWLIEMRSDKDTMDVRELGRRGREMRDLKSRSSYTSPSDLCRVFRHIWPPKEGSKDWRDDWESLPLQA